jgi:hypothetical protein
MTVEFQLERQDFLAFSKERRRFVSERLSRLYYFGILPALGVGLAIAAQSFAVAAAFTVLFIASGWFIQDRIQRSHLDNFYSNENLILSARRWNITLADDGIRVASDAVEVFYRWAFIKRVFRGTRYIHFELTPIQQVHIPIRAFSDEEHILRFIEKAQSYLTRPAV